MATPIDPMHQFMIQKIVELPSVTVPGLGAIDLSITNYDEDEDDAAR